jgi:hypothetical protein
MRNRRFWNAGRSVESPDSLKKGAPTPLSGLQARASRWLGHRLIRDRADDRYVFSYPRSGSTWLRTILANLIDPTVDGGDPDQRRATIPGVSIRSARLINSLRSPRLIKSHARYMGPVPRAIYLVRDGRDVLVSLYHYRITRPGHGERIDFPDFCRRYFRGDLGDMWHENVLSWLRKGSPAMGSSLKVLRFEDFKSDVAGRVAEVADFLGIEATLDQVQASVEHASLDRLREIERTRQGELSANRTFYRGGKVGQWQEMLTGELAERFLELSRPAFLAAGYQV